MLDRRGSGNGQHGLIRERAAKRRREAEGGRDRDGIGIQLQDDGVDWTSWISFL
jgi:hypothetical protein